MPFHLTPQEPTYKRSIGLYLKSLQRRARKSYIEDEQVCAFSLSMFVRLQLVQTRDRETNKKQKLLRYLVISSMNLSNLLCMSTSRIKSYGLPGEEEEEVTISEASYLSTVVQVILMNQDLKVSSTLQRHVPWRGLSTLAITST